jgi:Flp pilus assembly protein TadG
MRRCAKNLFRPPCRTRVIGRGAALGYVVATLAVLLLFCSLAVDLGRVWLAKSELRLAADAAARYAVGGLPDGYKSAQSRAVTSAAENRVDGTPVVLSPDLGDIEFGTWDAYTHSFTALNGAARDEATAVRINARRTAARDNAVSLVFAGILGRRTCDANATAVATVAPAQYGMVGLDSVRLWGNTTSSYWSASGVTTPGNWGAIASNGDISLGGSARVRGDARPGPGHTVSNSGKVSGVSTPLPAPLSYPPADPSPYGPSYNDNLALPSSALSGADFKPSSSVSLPGGHYFFRDFRVSGSTTVTFTGPALVYAYGTVDITGRVVTSGGLPKNLRLFTVANPSDDSPPGSVNVSSNGALYAEIYAPLSAFTGGGSSDIYGTVIARSVDMSGSSQFHYDLSIRNADGGIRLVQ